MKWFCFIFWFVWRLTLACLAHFNWCCALYTNCIFFSLWKSYDLLWFWMHLTLCSCFESLRRENYLLVWCNLIKHRRFKYPNLSYKEIYLRIYGGKGTKAERALENLETKERNERLTRRETRRMKKSQGEDLSSSSDDDDNISLSNSKRNGVTQMVHSADELAEREADKYLYVGHAVPSGNSLAKLEEEGGIEDDGGERMEMEEREGVDEEVKESSEEEEGDGKNTLEDTPLHRRKVLKKEQPIKGDIIISDPIETASMSSQSRWQRMKNFIPRHFKRQISYVDPNSIDILSPNYRNTYDIIDPRDSKWRDKHDRKALTKKLRARMKEELRIIAIAEKRRKKIADSIELFLQLLRMISSFAILVGNIRKTFIPAQFRYLRAGQTSYDNPELLAFFRFTCFLDVSMFWLNGLWATCLQWHLCCRLGIFRFIMWSALLGSIAFFVMLLPMSIAMDQLDLSWCHFAPNTTLYPYQPKWHW